MKIYLLTFAIFSAVLVSACGDAGTPEANNSANNASANSPTANSNNPLAVATPTPASTTNEAPTVGPVFKAYCAAVEKKDEATLRRVYSADTLREFEKTMAEDGIDSLVEYLSADAVSSAQCEVRNEVITGDTAVAEVKTKSMPNGAKILFVQEGGEWKITNRVPGFEKK